jgi:hypothetical protein
MGRVSHKVQTYRVSPVSGERRPTQFSSWTQYNDPGVLCVKDSLGTLHGRLNGRWDGGGPWFCTQDTAVFTPPSVTGKPTGLIHGDVRMGSALTSVTALSLNEPSESSLNASGATAIARTEPTNPAFDLSVTLGELMREGIPNAPGNDVMLRTKAAKAAGSEYLNVEFGWLPLVRSINDFATVVKNHDEIIRKYQEGANRTIKRSYQWEPFTETKWNPTGFGSVPANGNFTNGGRFQTVTMRRWFEVDYEYYLPTGGSTNDKIRRFGSYARKLLGVRLTPEVLWNLAPWSWAADWVGNTGDVIHNISAIGTDGLVIKNGYIMCHSRRETVDSGQYNGTGPMCYHTTVRDRKVRYAATPYGFGLSYEGLSLKQKAIIAALGMTKW